MDTDMAMTTARCYGRDGGIVPGRCAGYTYDGDTYCPACAEEINVPTADGDTYKMDHYPADTWDGNGFGVGVVSGFAEFDAPGASCGVCFKRLNTNIIHYED